ncbi:MAG: hypothetical protein WCC89_09655, partial [Candidatus Sulfotelmatobacter sp.]
MEIMLLSLAGILYTYRFWKSLVSEPFVNLNPDDSFASSTSGAKAQLIEKSLIAALKRCATQRHAAQKHATQEHASQR